MKTYFNPDTGECLYCHGDGECPYCAGEGEILGKECAACSGFGECPVCNGDGERELPETVDVPRRRSATRNRRSVGYQFDEFEINYHNRNSRQRVAVELLNPQVDNYRGHCVAAISDNDIPQNAIQQLIRILPQKISYDEYIAVEGLVRSNHQYQLIRSEMEKLFYPWWRRLVFGFFRILFESFYD